MTWIQIAPTAGASFLASAVECVEAATIRRRHLLLLFGMRWLRKAILRAAGLVPLHVPAAS